MIRPVLAFLALTTISCASTNSRAGAIPEVRKGCDALVFDVVTGHINGLTPDVSQERATSVLPCTTGATEDGSTFNYGGGVFFLKHDFFMYTGRNFIEVRAKFVGKEKRGLMGRTPAEVARALGAPKTTSEVVGAGFHPTAYGCARVEYQQGRVSRLAAHLEACESVMGWYRH